MSKSKCPICAKPVEVDARKCINCGYWIDGSGAIDRFFEESGLNKIFSSIAEGINDLISALMEPFHDNNDKSKKSNSSNSFKEHTNKSDSKDYFRILGLDPHAFDNLSEEEIQEIVKRSYKFFSKKYHPDKSGDPDKMKILNQAYECFLNPKTRKQYCQTHE